MMWKRSSMQSYSGESSPFTFLGSDVRPGVQREKRSASAEGDSAWALRAGVGRGTWLGTPYRAFKCQIFTFQFHFARLWLKKKKTNIK